MIKASILVIIDEKDEGRTSISGTGTELAAMLSLTAKRSPLFKRALMAVADQLTHPTDKEFSEMSNRVVERMESINASKN